MMAKRIDLNKSVYELTEDYPELIDILSGLGFTEITKKAMLHSVGKLTTIPKGAKLKHISMMDVATTLMSKGFELAGEMPVMSGVNTSMQSDSTGKDPQSRKEQLKGYLRRLGTGEELEHVRADFVKHFRNVEATEIMEAEQELLKEGTPLTEVQKLCDVHSALFHGATVEEQTVSEAKGSCAAELIAISGHPLYTFAKENEAAAELLAQLRTERGDALFAKIRDLSIHYAKKGDLLYPHLKVKYGFSGPSEVMWTVDDEIRDALGALAKETQRHEAWSLRLDAVLERAEEMIYKEQNILFPLCAENFTEEEWIGIYRDSKDYAPCFGVLNEKWDTAEAAQPRQVFPLDGEIQMPGGHMTLEQLTALLNTIPMEISFIDADNMNRYFNEGPKVFKRPAMAIDREVFSCHPPKIEPMVRAILDDFRTGVRDSVPVWMEKNGRTMLVNYMAVRDHNKRYLGTVELVQDMEFAKEHFRE